MYYRQFSSTPCGYTNQQCLMDCRTWGGYEPVSPYQAHFGPTSNYWYNSYPSMYSSIQINQESNNIGGEIGTVFLGVVQNGKFRILWPQSASSFTKLTEDSMYIGRDIIELKLDDREGMVMLVGGDYRGEWIYQVKIIEEAGPILTILTKQLFKVSD